MVLAVHAVALSISSAYRVAETGSFRFEFELNGDVDDTVSADLTVVWTEDKGGAFLSWIEVDRVRTRDQALARQVVSWVREHERQVFDVALGAEVW